ncbi:glycosyltransferase [Aureibaculum marinum]|uniref:Glycosyltransferase n=1 Tax=Aureibaculum marinum TaxID=2487930 RepID=A0A3N4P0D5_9FLAO|nr:glycosyltransferase [Aureibaculum marinum]RPD98010.1 glycosyltransferase [Aureibaculum marinum]
MKILFIIESLKAGGKERRMVSLIKGLLETKDVKIELLILSKNIHYSGINNLDINIRFLERNIKKDIRILSKFNNIINEFKPNVVHCWDNIAAFHFAPICKLKRIPFINSMISTAPLKLPILSKWFLSNAISYPFSDIILTNCKAGLNSFRVSKKKGKYIYNGFNFERLKIKLSPEQIRSKFNITQKYIVGMTAAFHDRKDYITFVKAGNKILKNRKDIVFLAIGDGPTFENIKSQVNDNVKDNFRFVGRQKDIESIVNIFDIGLLLTNTNCHGEGISNSIMEYMALSKPVIATKGGGTNEIVNNNETGFLIESHNEEQLIEKIEYLLDNNHIKIEMGKKGKMRIEKEFNLNKMIDKTYELYSKQIKKDLE